MSDNVPAVRDDQTLERTEPPIARADTDSWTQVVGVVARLAAEIAGTEFVPRALRGKPAAVTAAILYGREIGLAPMTALTQTHVIEGRPAASAEAMRALVLAAGHEIVIRETTGAVCIIGGRRRGSSVWTDISWTIDMARAANLAGKDNWKHHPRQMLQARATAELCRLVFPDVIHGMTALEEHDAEPETPAAETTVRRELPAKRAATPRKRAAATPPAETPEPAPAEEGGMPLPGEDGYVETATQPEEAAEETTGPGVPDDQGSTGTPAPTEEEGPGDGDTGPPEEERGHRVVAQAGPDGGTSWCDVCGRSGDDLTQPCPGTPPAPAAVTRAQLRMIFAELGGLAKTAEVTLDDEEQRKILSVLAGRTEPIASRSHLTKAEGKAVIDTLARVKTLDELYGVIEASDPWKVADQ